MNYQILDYKCGSNTCNIPVQIEVYDYSSIQRECFDYLVTHENEFLNDSKEYDVNLYERYKLGKMLNTNDRITYTINFYLEKRFFDWNIITLDNIDLLKMHGIYE